MFWAEITIKLKNEITDIDGLQTSLEARFGKSKDAVSVLDDIGFENKELIVDRINYANTDSNKLYLIYRMEVKTLIIMLKNSINENDLSKLKYNISELSNQVLEFLESFNNQIDELKAEIYISKDHIISLKSLNKVSQIKNFLLNNVYEKISFTVIILLLSLFYLSESDIKKAFIQTIAICIFAVLSIVIRILLNGKLKFIEK